MHHTPSPLHDVYRLNLTPACLTAGPSASPGHHGAARCGWQAGTVVGTRAGREDQFASPDEYGAVIFACQPTGPTYLTAVTRSSPAACPWHRQPRLQGVSWQELAARMRRTPGLRVKRGNW